MSFVRFRICVYSKTLFLTQALIFASHQLTVIPGDGVLGVLQITYKDYIGFVCSLIHIYF